MSRSVPLRLLLVAALLVAAVVPALSAVPAARATPSYGPLSGTISGPANLGETQNASYVVNVSGGPAVASNGTQVGIYSYNASVTGTNTTGVSFSPSAGSIPNGTVTLQLRVSNISQLLTLYVLVTSSESGTNATQNLSYSVNVLVPYRISATLVAGSSGTVSPFVLTVTLDGTPVGAIPVGTLTAGAHTPIAYSYVNPNLAPGWHTFSISLAEEHGLVSFAGGAESISVSFYVAGPPPNDSVFLVIGIGAFVGVAFIWSLRVGAGRRGRPKK
ncbi:MAG: hypothetical protein L3K00_04875 [Thermoplasmata archaeon]|nr:hypothetical protein [Thermoplasmata archaeon]